MDSKFTSLQTEIRIEGELDATVHSYINEKVDMIKYTLVFYVMVVLNDYKIILNSYNSILKQIQGASRDLPVTVCSSANHILPFL